MRPGLRLVLLSQTKNPRLSSASATATGSTTAALGVSTNRANGTLYWVVDTSASPPTAAQVKAAQGSGGGAAVASGNQAVSAIGAQAASATGLTAGTVYYAYFMQEDAVGNQSTVASASFTGFAAETQAILNAFTTPATNARAAQIDTLVAALKSAGVWSLLDALWIMAAADSQAACINWINPATFTLSPQNSPTFAADRGYTGNGTSSYINTTFVPSTDGVNYTQNSAHASYWSRTSAVNDGIQMGARTSSSSRQLLVQGRTSSATFNARINVDTSPTALSGSNAGSGHFLVRRSASNAWAAYRNAVSKGSNTTVSSLLPAFAVALLAVNTNGTPASFSAIQMSAASIGASLSDQNVTDYYNALQAYMTSVGA